MLVRQMTYTDYDGVERTEDFYFNLTKAEVAEMEMSNNGGLSKLLERIIQTRDSKKMVEFMKDLVLRAYGVKSLDGRKIVKNQELRDDFSQTEAYSDLFMELATDAGAAAAFVNGIVPKNMDKPVVQKSATPQIQQ